MEKEKRPIRLKFGEGKILIAPVSFSDGTVGIMFSERLGTGKINKEHPTIRKGDTINEADFDIVFEFANKESLKVLHWAVEQILKDNDG